LRRCDAGGCSEYYSEYYEKITTNTLPRLAGFFLSHVTSLLLSCCTLVTYRRAARCSLFVGERNWWLAAILMVMQRTRNNNENKGFAGGQYARTEEELYRKALGLLDKCKIEASR
jgi:hypothetical protein